jgi:hypothetical protein
MSALLAVLLACAGEEAEPPTFARVQGEILTPSCAFSSCHAGAGGSAGLDLTEGAAWAAIVEVPARDAPDEVLVVPGDPLASYLWKKCAAEPGITGDPMPVGAAGGLDTARLALLTDWIEAGAAP